MSNFCKDCTYWTFSYGRVGGDKMGTCSNHAVVDKIEKDNDEKWDGKSLLHTEQWFGCVYFRKGSLTVTKLKPDGK